MISFGPDNVNNIRTTVLDARNEGQIMYFVQMTFAGGTRPFILYPPPYNPPTALAHPAGPDPGRTLDGPGRDFFRKMLETSLRNRILAILSRILELIFRISIHLPPILAYLGHLDPQFRPLSPKSSAFCLQLGLTWS